MTKLSAENFYGRKFGGAVFSVVMFLYIFINFACGFLIAFTIGLGRFYVAASALFSVTAILAVLLYVSSRRRESFPSVVNAKKFPPVFIVFSVLLSVGMFAGFGFINVAISDYIFSIGGNVVNSGIVIDSPFSLVMFLILYGLLPALFEEFMFRGLILSALGKNIVAAVISGLIFALYHCNIAQFVYQFLYGFSLALLALKSGSVLPSVISHFINNAAVLSFMYFKFDVPLFDPILIICGVAVFSLFLLFVFLAREKGKDATDCVGTEEKKEDSLKKFFLFSAPGIAACALITISNVITF